MNAIVYRFRDASGRLLYVGATSAGPKRWGEHALVQPWWPEVATVQVEHHDSLDAAFAAEASAIRTEDPLHNHVHTHRATVKREVKPRRPSGTGSVFQRQDGRWVAAIGRGPRGSRHITRIYSYSRREAELALADLIRSDVA